MLKNIIEKINSDDKQILDDINNDNALVCETIVLRKALKRKKSMFPDINRAKVYEVLVEVEINQQKQEHWVVFSHTKNGIVLK